MIPCTCPHCSFSLEHPFWCFLTELNPAHPLIPRPWWNFSRSPFGEWIIPSSDSHRTWFVSFLWQLYFSAVCYSYLCPCLFLPLNGELLNVAKEHVLSNSDSPHSVANACYMVGAQSKCGMTLNYKGWVLCLPVSWILWESCWDCRQMINWFYIPFFPVHFERGWKRKRVKAICGSILQRFQPEVLGEGSNMNNN